MKVVKVHLGRRKEPLEDLENIQINVKDVKSKKTP